MARRTNWPASRARWRRRRLRARSIPPRSTRRESRGDLDPAAIDCDLIEARLDTHELPPLDLLIRTSGEQRLSNFLLWQAAYAELLFVDTLWPDFDGPALESAVAEFGRRERRYGGL